MELGNAELNIFGMEFAYILIKKHFLNFNINLIQSL